MRRPHKVPIPHTSGLHLVHLQSLAGSQQAQNIVIIPVGKLPFVCWIGHHAQMPLAPTDDGLLSNARFQQQDLSARATDSQHLLKRLLRVLHGTEAQGAYHRVKGSIRKGQSMTIRSYHARVEGQSRQFLSSLLQHGLVQVDPDISLHLAGIQELEDAPGTYRHFKDIAAGICEDFLSKVICDTSFQLADILIIVRCHPSVCLHSLGLCGASVAFQEAFLFCLFGCEEQMVRLRHGP
mmetsp:Transcript_21103/g.46478  ORF Transcript_21103/g.46478 Transcript_21103/m.46478 type:complete len:237 (-) Transcript_21103:145-855(-)